MDHEVVRFLQTNKFFLDVFEYCFLGFSEDFGDVIFSVDVHQQGETDFPQILGRSCDIFHESVNIYLIAESPVQNCLLKGVTDWQREQFCLRPHHLHIATLQMEDISFRGMITRKVE